MISGIHKSNSIKFKKKKNSNVCLKKKTQISGVFHVNICVHCQLTSFFLTYIPWELTIVNLFFKLKFYFF